MPKKPKKPGKVATNTVSGKTKRSDADKAGRIRELETVATLKDLRKAAQRTQDELAEIMGVGQGAISRIEKRDDMLVSTLQHYVESLGGSFRILATFPDRPPLIVERLGKKEKAANSSGNPGRQPAAANGHAHA